MANKTKLEWSPHNLSILFQAARLHGVSKFKLGDIEFEMGNQASAMAYDSDNPSQTAKNIAEISGQIKSYQLDELILSDPAKYEEVIEKMHTEQVNAEEVIVQ